MTTVIQQEIFLFALCILLLVKFCQSLTIRTSLRLRPPFEKASFIRQYTSFLNLGKNIFYWILFLSTLLFSTKYFCSLKPRKAQTYSRSPLRFHSNGMILFYRKSYFNFLLNQFHMTEKRKPLSKESGRLTVQMMEHSSCSFPYKVTGPL